MKLVLNALVKYIAGLILVGVLVFLPAGSFEYKNGWLFVALLFIPMFFLGVVMLIKAPALLRRRLDSKEKESTQKGVVAVAGLIFLAGFVVAGLDYRFGWSHIPSAVVWVAAIMLLISYGMYAEVMRENAYLSRTVKVEEGQKLIDSGLYGVVRHPMYTATIVLFLSIPLVLGSLWSFALFLLYPAVIVVRVLNEEKVLEKELLGYREYKKKVKWRIIPFVW